MTTIKSICSDTLLFFLFSIVHLQGFISIRSISHHRIKRLKINIVVTGGMAIVSPIQIGKIRKTLRHGEKENQTLNIWSIFLSNGGDRVEWVFEYFWAVKPEGFSSHFNSALLSKLTRNFSPPAQIKVLPNISTWRQSETYKERLERFSFPLIFLFFLLFLWYYRRLE